MWRLLTIKNKEIKMTYTKPQVIAKNNPTGSFAAGCPEWKTTPYCKECERAS